VWKVEALELATGARLLVVVFLDKFCFSIFSLGKHASRPVSFFEMPFIIKGTINWWTLLRRWLPQWGVHTKYTSSWEVIGNYNIKVKVKIPKR